MYDQVRQIISHALATEQQQQSLLQMLDDRSQSLHKSIQIQAKDRLNTLQFFIVDYIQHVPDCLDCIHQQAVHYGLFEAIEPFLKVTEDFFLHPPQRLQLEHQGLEALLDESYLAHRLFEELNDQFLARCQVNLLPRDLSEANLIVHDLIGDPFASELDSMVHQMAIILAKKFQTLDTRSLPKHKVALFDQFPDFTDPHGLSLKFA